MIDQQRLLVESRIRELTDLAASLRNERERDERAAQAARVMPIVAGAAGTSHGSPRIRIGRWLMRAGTMLAGPKAMATANDMTRAAGHGVTAVAEPDPCADHPMRLTHAA